MDETNKTTVSPVTPRTETIPAGLAQEARELVHELSNSLEVIVQTSYLLGTLGMKEPGSDWLRMLDEGVRKAMDTNLILREFLRSNSQR